MQENGLNQEQNRITERDQNKRSELGSTGLSDPVKQVQCIPDETQRGSREKRRRRFLSEVRLALKGWGLEANESRSLLWIRLLLIDVARKRASIPVRDVSRSMYVARLSLELSIQ